MFDFTLPIYQVEPLLPHSGKMVLLEQISDFGRDFLIAQTQLKEDCLLMKNGEVAGFMGAEIMAQGIAAWAGIYCLKAGKPVDLGYWIGSRKLSIHSATLPLNTPLQIVINLSTEDVSGFGVFDCQLINLQNHQSLVDGRLNVYRPNNAT